MILNKKILQELRELINEKTEYRSGPKLVEFFNDLGFQDEYKWGGSFPSRWVYTDDRLNAINGTPELDKCIKKLFSPVNFIGRLDELDEFIDDFNKYISFDEWLVIRTGKEISFKKVTSTEWEERHNESDEEEFINREFEAFPLQKLSLNPQLISIIEERLEEIEKSLSSESPLSVIFLCGSTLEGILLGMAENYPKEFNTAKGSPKKEGKTRKLHEWSLNNFIDVAHEIGFLKEDVKKYSHVLREFRNYIHPYQQMSQGFSPDIHSAKISVQVLKAAINQIHEKTSV